MKLYEIIKYEIMFSLLKNNNDKSVFKTYKSYFLISSAASFVYRKIHMAFNFTYSTKTIVFEVRLIQLKL